MNNWKMELSYLLNKFSHKMGVGARLIIIVSLHILIIGGNAYIAYTGVNKIENDSLIINYSGMIRGGIQKVSKMETNGITAIEDSKKIDALFEKFLVTDKKELLAHNMNFFINQLDELHMEWVILKKEINQYHKNPSDSNKEIILVQSEKCWIAANQTVNMAEALSEAKMSTFQIMFFVFFIDFLLIIAIIWIINSTIRHHLEVVSRVDPLTGIFNRNVYNEEIYLEIERCRRYSYGFSLLLIDIDFFKHINDTHGHDIGDDILKKATNVVSSIIRKNDLFCRIGGEEFIILATETDIENAKALAEKIRTAIENCDFSISKSMTVSIGLSAFRPEDTKDTIFKRTDEALYTSKTSGRNRVSVIV